MKIFFSTFSFVNFLFITTRRWFYRRHFLCNAATLEYNFLKWFSTLHFLCLLLVGCFVGWLVGRLPYFGLLLSSQRREVCKYFSCQLCPASMTMPLSWLAQQEDRRTDQTTDCILVAVVTLAGCWLMLSLFLLLQIDRTHCHPSYMASKMLTTF